MVSMLSFCFNDPSFNPAEENNFKLNKVKMIFLNEPFPASFSLFSSFQYSGK